MAQGTWPVRTLRKIAPVPILRSVGKSLPSPFTFPDGLSKTILLSEILTGDNNSAAFTFPRDMLYLVPTSAITTVSSSV